MEQALVLILVIGRWLLPKGDITRDQLSQLLLSYIGTAADIMEFTEIIKDDIRRRNPEMLQNKHFVNAIFLLWSVSLFQFSLTIYAMERTEQRLENGKAQPMEQLNKLRREKGLRRRRNRVAPSEALYTNKKNRCKEHEDVQVSYIQTKSGLDIKPGMVTGARMEKDEAVIQKISRGGRFSLHRITKLLSNSTIKMQHHSELIRLFIPLFMQDGPFLIIRLIVIAYYGVYHDTLYFLTVKNALVVMIQVYRIFVLCYKPPEKDIDDFFPENDAAQTREIPILPWQVVASDVLEHKNQNYLVVIDYYSKYIEAIRLNGKTNSDIIGCLNEIFSRHGYPQTLIADNMPYNSREMKEYATQYGIHITTTSPTYSQANGLAEKAVHIVKNLLRKECNLNEGLMEYRNTPISNFPYSPNQMLFSRQIRTRVPVHPLVLVPQICHDVPELLEKRQFYDRQGSKHLPQLKEGDSVRFKKPGDKHLSHAIVTGKHDTPRSYMITGETGREYRRNRRHVHLTQEPPITIIDYDLIDESQPVTMQSSVNSPSVTREQDANLEPDPPDTDSSSAPRRTTRVRSVPVWHKDYVM